MALAMAPSTRRPRRNKYGNTPVVIDNIRFASKAEGARYAELKLLERAKQISHLRCQPKLALYSKAGAFIANYIGDFSYMERGLMVVEDVKSPATAKNRTFVNKWKHAQADYNGIQFRLITKKRASSGRVGERAA